MTQLPKIVILYANFGDGHYQVAKALKDQFTAQGTADVHMIDLFGEAHPFWNACSTFVYKKSMSWFPRLYGWSYEVTKSMRSEGLFGNWLHSFGTHRLQAILEEKRPDAVIHTFPFLALYHLKSTTDLTIPGYTIITDYVLHSRWLHPYTDYYFVATESLKAEMMGRGVPQDRIQVTGIPIRKAFSERKNDGDSYELYRFHQQTRYVMVIVQDEGILKDLESLIPGLIAQKDELSFLLVCGRNAKLYREAMKHFKEESAVHVFAYVEHIERLMAASACIITKAGGVTLTEALALHLPVIVYRPLPGQERGKGKEEWNCAQSLNWALA